MDDGVLLKAGRDLLVPVRRAIAESDLGRLREVLADQLLALHEHERSMRPMLATMARPDC